MAAGAVSLRKSHDIVMLSFCNEVKGQANFELTFILFKIFSYTHLSVSFFNLPFCEVAQNLIDC